MDAQKQQDTVHVFAMDPVLVRSLLFDHRRTPDGLCRGCTQPGHGVPYRPYPCLLSLLAEEAAALHRTVQITTQPAAA